MRRKVTNYEVEIGLYQDRMTPSIQCLILEQPSGGYRIAGGKGCGTWDVVRRFKCSFTSADLAAAMAKIQSSGDSQP